jgi:hypothetical protein
MSDRDEITYRLNILFDQLADGKIYVAPHLREKFDRSLAAVLYDFDGLVRLDTVDGSVRALALGVAADHERTELKKAASLRDIQIGYVDMIRANFGSFYDQMLRQKLDPYQAGLALSKDAEMVRKLDPQISDFLVQVAEFWNTTADVASNHIADLQATKSVFGGDLFPSIAQNIVSSCGIYVDTIVLPDPFLRTMQIFESADPERRAYYVTKHALNLLQYSPYILADVNPPIAVILPEEYSNREEEKLQLIRMMRQDAAILAQKIFGVPFSSFEEFEEFLNGFSSDDEFVKAVKEPKRVLFDTEWTGDLKSQFVRSAENTRRDGMDFGSSIGNVLMALLAGRMGQTNDLLLKAERINATPLMDAPTSWQYFVWKAESTAEGASADAPLHTVNGLQRASANEMSWLGKLPPDALIEIRKQGAMPELRNVLGRGIEALAHARPTNFFRTTDQVVQNIQDAFEEHKRKIADLSRKRWRFAGVDIGLGLVYGAIEIAAACGVPGINLANKAIDNTIGKPDYKSIPSKYKGLKQEREGLHKSPIGVLFEQRSRLS